MGPELIALLFVVGGIVLLITGHTILGIIALGLGLLGLVFMALLAFVVGKIAFGAWKHIRGRSSNLP